MKTPTAKQVSAEIEKLKDLLDKVPPTTIFGDSNTEKIEAQIRVLEKDLGEDAIYGNTRDGSLDDAENESREWSFDAGQEAIYARNWLDGEEKDAPSKGWAELVKLKAKRK